jgi:hypothetical protein
MGLAALFTAAPASAQFLNYDNLFLSGLRAYPSYYGAYDYGYPYAVTFPTYPLLRLDNTPYINLPIYRPWLALYLATRNNNLAAARQAAAPARGTRAAVGTPRPGRYYLDPVARPPAEGSVLDQVGSQIRVESVDEGLYLVRWTGQTDGVTAVEFQALGADEKVLERREVKEAPFRGLLKVPAETEQVMVRVVTSAGSTSVKVPVKDFKALDVR